MGAALVGMGAADVIGVENPEPPWLTVGCGAMEEVGGLGRYSLTGYAVCGRNTSLRSVLMD